MTEPHLVCDFCLAPDPPWEYRVRDATVMLPGITESLGTWLACEICRPLIDQNERAALAERSASNASALTGFKLSAVLARQTQEIFFEQKVGEARPVKITPMHGRVFTR